MKDFDGETVTQELEQSHLDIKHVYTRTKVQDLSKQTLQILEGTEIRGRDSHSNLSGKIVFSLSI